MTAQSEKLLEEALNLPSIERAAKEVFERIEQKKGG